MLLTHLHLVPFIVLYTSLSTIVFFSIYAILELCRQIEDMNKFERDNFKPGSKFQADGGIQDLKDKLHSGRHS